MNRQKTNSNRQIDKPSRDLKTLKRLKPIVPYVPVVVQKKLSALVS